MLKDMDCAARSKEESAFIFRDNAGDGPIAAFWRGMSMYSLDQRSRRVVARDGMGRREIEGGAVGRPGASDGGSGEFASGRKR